MNTKSFLVLASLGLIIVSASGCKDDAADLGAAIQPNDSTPPPKVPTPKPSPTSTPYSTPSGTPGPSAAEDTAAKSALRVNMQGIWMTDCVDDEKSANTKIKEVLIIIDDKAVHTRQQFADRENCDGSPTKQVEVRGELKLGNAVSSVAARQLDIKFTKVTSDAALCGGACAPVEKEGDTFYTLARFSLGTTVPSRLYFGDIAFGNGLSAEKRSTKMSKLYFKKLNIPALSTLN